MRLKLGTIFFWTSTAILAQSADEAKGFRDILLGSSVKELPVKPAAIENEGNQVSMVDVDGKLLAEPMLFGAPINSVRIWFWNDRAYAIRIILDPISSNLTGDISPREMLAYVNLRSRVGSQYGNLSRESIRTETGSYSAIWEGREVQVAVGGSRRYGEGNDARLILEVQFTSLKLEKEMENEAANRRRIETKARKDGL